MTAELAIAALTEARGSWAPMIAIALAQVTAPPISLSGMVASFNVPPTTVATSIVMYGLAVAGFVMLGAKPVQRFGSTVVFRVVVALFGFRVRSRGWVQNRGRARDKCSTVLTQPSVG